MEYSDLEVVLDKVFKDANRLQLRYIYTNNRVMRMLRRYRPRPNRCVRTFKLRKMRK